MKISVVIPAYNESQYIAATLQSLQKQDFKGDFEVIVVDNNSCDNTSEVARENGAIVIRETKRGVCAARQAGTEAATGEIIVSTDADTTFPTNWLSKIHTEFEKNPVLAAVAGPCRFVDGPLWGKFYTPLVFGSVRIVKKITDKVFYIPGCNTAFKKEFWSGYNTELTQGGDEMFLLQQLQPKGEIKYDFENAVSTSGRRLNRGLLYNVLVTFFVYYFFDYSFGKLTGKSFFGSYPAFRDNSRFNRWSVISSAALIALFLLIAGSFSAPHALAKRVGAKADSYEDRIKWPIKKQLH